MANMRTESATITLTADLIKAALEEAQANVDVSRTITWPRDVVLKPGPGWVDGEAYGWANELLVNLDHYESCEDAAARLSRDVKEQLGRIRLKWDQAIEQVVYKGWNGKPGLLNNPGVKSQTVDHIGPDNTVGLLLQAHNNDTSCDRFSIVLPPAQFESIEELEEFREATKKLLSKQVGRYPDIEVLVFGSQWCVGSGENNTGRVVVYDAGRTILRITVPIERSELMKQDGNCYRFLYVGQMMPLELPETLVYADIRQ